MKQISLIIPVKNEESNVTALMQSIADQSLCPSEVIIVDGGSSDRTCELIETFKTDNFTLVLIKTEGATPGLGRNIGASRAGFDLIAFTDAGIKLDRQWLEELYKCLVTEDADIVYGMFHPVITNPVGIASLFNWVPEEQPCDKLTMRCDFIASSIMKRNLFDKIGGFPDFRAAEDRIFMEKVPEYTSKISYCPSAVVFWEIPETFSGIFNRFLTLSFHDLKANRSHLWHRQVIKMWGFALLYSVTSIFSKRKRYLIFLIFGVLARTMKNFYKRYRFSTLKNKISEYNLFTIFPICFFLTILIDIACLSGYLKFKAYNTKQ